MPKEKDFAKKLKELEKSEKSYEQMSKEDEFEASVTYELMLDKARQRGEKVVEAFQKARRKAGDRYSELAENMAFYEGRQYQLSRYKVSRPWVVRMRTPFASVAIDTRVSSLIASDYRGDLIPMAPEEQDKLAGLDAFKNDEWERMNLNQKINEAIKVSSIVRESYIHLIWKDEKLGSGTYERDGYIDAYVIDSPSAVYIDPNATCLRDARYVCIVTRKSADELAEMYPLFAEAIEETGAKLSPEERGEVFYGEDYTTEQHDVRSIITMYKKEQGKIKKCTVVENILVDEKILDGLTNFPIAQMRWKRAANSPYGIALMDELIDIQKAINAIESAVTNTAVSYSSPSYGVRKGSGVDPKELAVAAGAPGMVISVEGNIDEAIKPIKLPQLDSSIVAVKQDYVNAIDRIAGISNPYLGSVGTAGNTQGGTKMALERARIIEQDVLHNVELFVEDITNILIEYIGAQYSGQTVPSRKLDKATGTAYFTSLDVPEGVEYLQYSFFINLSAKTSYSKEREKELILELYQMQHQYKDDVKLINQLDILGAYDLSNREILVDRYKKLMQSSNEQKAQIITQLMTMSKQVGIGEDMVQKAIEELLSGISETPITDQLMSVIQQKAQEQAALRENTMQGFQQDLQQAGVPQQAIQMAQQQVTGGQNQ